jgi:hypothetical protein
MATMDDMEPRAESLFATARTCHHCVRNAFFTATNVADRQALHVCVRHMIGYEQSPDWEVHRGVLDVVFSERL